MQSTKLSVCGVIFYQGHFLIVKRSPTDEFLPNCWEFPGGSVESSETIEKALIRELQEEIGINISLYKKELIGISEEFMDKNKTERYLQLNYKIELPKESKIILSSEHVKYDWVTKEDPRLDEFCKNIIEQG